MTSMQLRMALAADGRRLADIADDAGVHESQLSRARKGNVALDFMDRMRRYFTAKGVEFSQVAGAVIVKAPDPFPKEE